MDKVCRLTGNTKLGKNGFSSADAVIEWGNKVKDVITKAITSDIQQNNNEHALALVEMRTVNKR